MDIFETNSQHKKMIKALQHEANQYTAHSMNLKTHVTSLTKENTYLCERLPTIYKQYDESLYDSIKFTNKLIKRLDGQIG